jgi:hypothetical protein
MHVANSTSPWAVQLRNSYDTISNIGGFSESDLAVLTTTLNQDFFYYVGPDIEFVVYPVDNAAGSATQLSCLQLPSPDALTRSGDRGGQIQRGISRTLRSRAYLDLLDFLKTFLTGPCACYFGYWSRCFGNISRLPSTQFQGAV